MPHYAVAAPLRWLLIERQYVILPYYLRADDASDMLCYGFTLMPLLRVALLVS